ncbi:MAG TPA: DUF3817 domain-containing protein [Candidatus Saccharimonadales bacterium]|jgi:integral membrane protein
MLGFLQQFEKARPFTEAEAWLLFRIVAVAEACGWTLLIAGIAADTYLPHAGGPSALILAGRTHGMLFLLYCLASLGLYPSLGWSRWRGLFALAFSVPPYGSLLFEQWAAAKRHNAGFRTYRHFLLYNLLLAQS